MYDHPGVKTSPDFAVPDEMRAWVLGDPDQLTLETKPVPVPGKAEVLVRIDAIAVCATKAQMSAAPSNTLGVMPAEPSVFAISRISGSQR